jgi:hypothetical protein
MLPSDGNVETAEIVGGNRFPAFATLASAGEGRPDRTMV